MLFAGWLLLLLLAMAMAEEEEDNNLLVASSFLSLGVFFFFFCEFVSLAYDALNAHSNLRALISLELVASVHSHTISKQ